MGGEVALGHRENLRWYKLSSFILTTCLSSARDGQKGKKDVERRGKTEEQKREFWLEHNTFKIFTCVHSLIYRFLNISVK